MKFNGTNLLVTLLVTLVPIFILKWKGLNKKSNLTNLIYSTSWSLLSIFIIFLLLILAHKNIYILTILPTLIIGSGINYLILNEKLDIKKIPKTLIVLILFLMSSVFQLIPINLFNLNMDKLTGTQDISLTIFSDICLLVILLVIYRKEIKKNFIDFKNNFNKYMDIGFKYWIVGLMIMMASNIIIQIISPNQIANNEKAVRELIGAAPLLTLFTTGFLAPILEETTFRFSLRDVIKSNYLFIFFSGLVFGLLHVIFSFTSLWDFLYVIPYGTLGGAFAFMLVKTDNIFTCISMHMIHNIIFTLTSIIALTMVLM